MDFDKRITLISRFIQEWLHEHDKDYAIPKDVIDYLIEKEVYTYDNKNGRPLRDDLRRLRQKGEMEKIRGLKYKEHTNPRWYFYKMPKNDTE